MNRWAVFLVMLGDLDAAGVFAGESVDGDGPADRPVGQVDVELAALRDGATTCSAMSMASPVLLVT